jgi:hypothetical protein
MTDIKLWLDSYNDIYSDFDSRHYLKRRISEDFLDELRNELKISESLNGDIIFLLPQTERDVSSEKVIAKGLTEYFKKQYGFHKNKCQHKLNKGVLLFASGFFIMLLNSWCSFHYKETFIIIFFRILLEPAGWFLLWAAFDFLFYDFTKLKTVRDFYRLLSNANINFTTADKKDNTDLNHS